MPAGQAIDRNRHHIGVVCQRSYDSRRPVYGVRSYKQPVAGKPGHCFCKKRRQSRLANASQHHSLQGREAIKLLKQGREQDRAHIGWRFFPTLPEAMPALKIAACAEFNI